jgi:hypothetical protein
MSRSRFLVAVALILCGCKGEPEPDAKLCRICRELFLLESKIDAYSAWRREELEKQREKGINGLRVVDGLRRVKVDGESDPYKPTRFSCPGCDMAALKTEDAYRRKTEAEDLERYRQAQESIRD